MTETRPRLDVWMQKGKSSGLSSSWPSPEPDGGPGAEAVTEEG